MIAAMPMTRITLKRLQGRLQRAEAEQSLYLDGDELVEATIRYLLQIHPRLCAKLATAAVPGQNRYELRSIVSLLRH